MLKYPKICVKMNQIFKQHFLIDILSTTITFFFLQMEAATECQFGQWILYRIRLPIEFQGDLSNVF